ncbi:transposase [Streptomyces chartreusis]|uniref:transposase n=1 Tax=Streptomyces chartreusis TaxID=1969 RepID=UPI00368582C0
MGARPAGWTLVRGGLRRLVPACGRPGLSPAQRATVCVLQFLLSLSDRQAVEAVRCRIDFKYAMAMELDDPGFHHSVVDEDWGLLRPTGPPRQDPPQAQDQDP